MLIQRTNPQEKTVTNSLSFNAKLGIQYRPAAYKYPFLTAKSRTSSYVHPKAQGCPLPAHCSATWKWNFFLHTFDAVPPSTKYDTKEDFTALNITEYTYCAFWSWLTDPQI